MALGRTIARLSVALGINTASFEKGSKKAEGTLGRLRRLMIGPVGLAAAATGVTAALTRFTMGAIKTADEVSKAAQSIGIGTEELSRLRYAAEQSNVSFQQLQTGVRIMSRNMVAAANGSAAQSAAFERLGVSVVDADGKMRSATEVMGDLADRFARMPDGAQKTAASFAVMGRAGAQMIPMLNGGRDAFIEAMQEAENFGVVIDEDTGRRAEAFQSNMTRLQGVTSNLGTSIAAELLPHLVELTDWLVENQKRVVAWGRDFARAVRHAAEAAASAFNQIARLTNAVGDFLDRLPQDIFGLGRAIGIATDRARSGAGSLSLAYMKLHEDAQRAGRAVAEPFEMIEPAANAAGSAISSSIGDAMREAQREAEELQRVLERLFPDRRFAREFAEDQARINAIMDEGERIAARRALALEQSTRVWAERDAQMRSVDLGGRGSPLDEGVNRTLRQLDRMVKGSNEARVRVVKSMKDMADETLGALNRMASAIQGGGFLSILEGLIGLGLQLGSIGAFGKGIAGNINRIPAYASGTNFHPGGMALVGERGPELVSMPRGSKVYPNGTGPATQVQVIPSPYFDVVVDGRVASAAPGIAEAGARGGMARVAFAQSRRI